MGEQQARTYHLTVYGCQMNEHEAEYMAGLLEANGYHRADAEQADLLVVHTCCIRDSAESKIYGRIGQFKQLKRKNPQLLLAVGGCMTQAPEGVTRLLQHAPHVDIVFGTHNVHRLPELVAAAQTAGERIVEISEEESLPVANRPLRRASPISAWVEIMAGCNNFCGYCIVPYVRGRQRSRPVEDILQELESLREEGYAEVVLLGQNVNSYGEDLPKPVSFAHLLREVDAHQPIPRVRFVTSHPRDFTEDLIEAMASLNSVCEHVHLPVQAGSDRILTAMGRGYTSAQYLDVVEKLRKAMPNVGLSTDIIVGYPGESEEDFLATLGLAKRAQFNTAYTFMFSPRQGTRAAGMTEQVSAQVKRERLFRLIEVQNAISRQKNEDYVGGQVEVLIEGPSRKNPERVVGRTRTNQIVIMPKGELLPKDLVTAEIMQAFTWHLLGQEVTTS